MADLERGAERREAGVLLAEVRRGRGGLGYLGIQYSIGGGLLLGPDPCRLDPTRGTAAGAAGAREILPGASSQLDGWEASKLYDDDPNTVYSSNGHGEQSSATEWVALDFGLAATVSALRMIPRAGGLCFPVDYDIQYSTDMANWHTDRNCRRGMVTAV